MKKPSDEILDKIHRIREVEKLETYDFPTKELKKIDINIRAILEFLDEEWEKNKTPEQRQMEADPRFK